MRSIQNNPIQNSVETSSFTLDTFLSPRVPFLLFQPHFDFICHLLLHRRKNMDQDTMYSNTSASYENEFNLHANEISFSYEKMGTKTRFEEEAKGNSEMAYCSTTLHLFVVGTLLTLLLVVETEPADWDSGV